MEVLDRGRAGQAHVAGARQRAAQALRLHRLDREVVAGERDVGRHVVDHGDAAGVDVARDLRLRERVADVDRAAARARVRGLAEPAQPDVEVLAVGVDVELEGVLDGVDVAVDRRRGRARRHADLGEVDLIEVVIGGDHAAPIEAEVAERDVGEIVEAELLGHVARGVDRSRQAGADHVLHGGRQPAGEVERLGDEDVAVDAQRGELHGAGELHLAAGAARERLLDLELVVHVVDLALDGVEREPQRLVALGADREIELEAGQREDDLGQRDVRAAQEQVGVHVVAAHDRRERVVERGPEVVAGDVHLPLAVVGAVPVVVDRAADREPAALAGLDVAVELERVGDVDAADPLRRQLRDAAEQHVIERDRVDRLAADLEDVEERALAGLEAGPRVLRILRGRIGEREVELGHQRIAAVHVERAAHGGVAQPDRRRERGRRVLRILEARVVPHVEIDLHVAQLEVLDVEHRRARHRHAAREAGVVRRLERLEDADHGVVVGVQRVRLVDLLDQHPAAVGDDVAEHELLLEEQRVDVGLAGDEVRLQDLLGGCTGVPHLHTSHRHRHPAAGGERRQRAGRPLDRLDLDPAAHLRVEQLGDAVAEVLALELDAQQHDRGDDDQDQAEPDPEQPPAEFRWPAHTRTSNVSRRDRSGPTRALPSSARASIY